MLYVLTRGSELEKGHERLTVCVLGWLGDICPKRVTAKILGVSLEILRDCSNPIVGRT